MTISDVRSLIALCIRIVRCSLGHGLLCDVWLYELHPQKAVGLLLVMCWVSPERREYSMSTAVAAAPARQNDRICSSCGSWSFLPASLLAPCLPWIQQTAHTWGTVRQLVSQTGSAIQSSTCRWLWLLTGDLFVDSLFPQPWFLCTSWKDLWASLWACQGPCTLTPCPSWSPETWGWTHLPTSPPEMAGPGRELHES